MGSRAVARRSRATPADQTDLGEMLTVLMAEAVRWTSRDVSLTSLSTLSTLERTGPRRITDLAVVQGVTQPSMTALVGGLVRAGLVARRGDPRDRRVVLLEITGSGKRLIRDRRHANAEMFTDLIEKLPPDEVAALRAALPALRHLRQLTETQRDPTVRSSED